MLLCFTKLYFFGVPHNATMLKTDLTDEELVWQVQIERGVGYFTSVGMQTVIFFANSHFSSQSWWLTWIVQIWGGFFFLCGGGGYLHIYVYLHDPNLNTHTLPQYTHHRVGKLGPSFCMRRISILNVRVLKGKILWGKWMRSRHQQNNTADG